MRVISSSPFFYKRIVGPFFFVIGMVGAMLFALNMWSHPASIMERLFGALGHIAFGIYFLVPALALADEVRDTGDVLIVRKSGLEARVPLADIIDIKHVSLWLFFFWPWTNSSVLTLRTPCRFGSKVKFVPMMSGFMKPDPAIYDTLTVRINDARRQALRSNAAHTTKP